MIVQFARGLGSGVHGTPSLSTTVMGGRLLVTRLIRSAYRIGTALPPSRMSCRYCLQGLNEIPTWARQARLMLDRVASTRKGFGARRWACTPRPVLRAAAGEPRAASALPHGETRRSSPNQGRRGPLPRIYRPPIRPAPPAGPHNP